MKLQGKIAIVTGASAGIGRAYALALAGEGATVVAAARRFRGNESVEKFQDGSIHPRSCDVEREAEVMRLIEETVIQFGRIDVLVNNAAATWRLASLEVPGDSWDRMMATNVRAPYVAIREAAPQMIRQRSGSIINITAGAANMTPRSNYPGMLAYAVSKAALNRLSYFMASELKPHGIAVNALSPGVVASESAVTLDPTVATRGTHKPCTPDVLGPALLHLAGATAETLTGQLLHTDEFGKTWPQG